MAKSYAADIKPLFRPKGIACMAGQGVSLDDPAYMCYATGDGTYPDHANARLVYTRLTDVAHRMPPDGAWPQARLDTYSSGSPTASCPELKSEVGRRQAA